MTGSDLEYEDILNAERRPCYECGRVTSVNDGGQFEWDGEADVLMCPDCLTPLGERRLACSCDAVVPESDGKWLWDSEADDGVFLCGYCARENAAAYRIQRQYDIASWAFGTGWFSALIADEARRG